MRLYLEFFDDMAVLTVINKSGRTEFRGSSRYGAANAPRDQLADILDSLSGPLVSGLMSGNVEHLPKPGRCAMDYAFVNLALRWPTEDETAMRRYVIDINDRWGRK